jgi:hypothetical protein
MWQKAGALRIGLLEGGFFITTRRTYSPAHPGCKQDYYPQLAIFLTDRSASTVV